MTNLYKAFTSEEVITENTVIRPDEFSCIYFENIGTDNATINNAIPLNNVGIGRYIKQDPGTIIGSEYMITFEGVATDKRILVVKTTFKSL